jgi:hypothetical protein
MDSTGSTEAQRKSLQVRRQDAITSSIYELFVSVDDPDQISVLDIFNRLMLLLQSACMFVLVEYNPKTKKVKRDRKKCKVFNPHPLHQEAIYRAIKDADEDNFIEIFGSETYRLLVLLPDQDRTASHHRNYAFKPIGESDKEQTRNVLDKNIYLERFDIDVLDALKKIVNNCRGLTEIQENTKTTVGEIEDFKDIKEKFKIDEDKDYKYWYEDFFIKSLESRQRGYDLPHDGVLDKAYKKSRRSLSYQGSGYIEPELANFLFFLRDYSVDGLKRADNYDFGLRILLCSKQEQDIRSYLVRLAAQDNLKTWYRDLIGDETNPYYKTSAAANGDFWSKLEQVKKEHTRKTALDNLIRIIKKPLGKNSYSMAEQIFLSGIIHFRNPSVNAGLHRCIPDIGIEKEYKDLDQDEILRVVIVHYLLLGMAHSFGELEEKISSNSTHKKSFSAMLAPISIGGRILGVLSYVTEKDKSNKADASVAELSRPWRKNFHIYMATHKRIKRHLRTYLWQFYVVTVFHMYYDSAMKVMNIKEGTYDDVQDILNLRLSYIDRFFSYNSIRCEIKQTNVIDGRFPNSLGVTWGQIGDDHVMPFTVKETARLFSFYPGIEQNKLSRFVDLPEIAVKISDAFYGIQESMKMYKKR